MPLMSMMLRFPLRGCKRLLPTLRAASTILSSSSTDFESITSGRGVNRVGAFLNHRGLSTDPKPSFDASVAAAESGGCPFTGAGEKSNSKKSKTQVENAVDVPLVQVPSYPYVGSRFNRNFPDIKQPYNFWLVLREKFGDFYSLGLPGLGSKNTPHGTLHVVTSPQEMVKVIKDGGKYPSGVFEVLWMNKKWFKDHDLALSRGADEGFMGRGPGWKRIRTFMQTDLLHPESARGYLPGIIKAAQFASLGAPNSNLAMNKYLNLCAFDMFSTLMFGEFTRMAEMGTNVIQDLSGAEEDLKHLSEQEKENILFVRSTVQALSTAVRMTRSPYEAFFGHMLGIQTSQYKHFDEGMKNVWNIASKKIASFVERKNNGQLTENERASYLSRAIDRQAEAGKDSPVTLEEVKEIAFNGLFAAVDTTSGVLGWNLAHLVCRPTVQETLHEELYAAVTAGPEKKLTPEMLSSRNVLPYLHAVIRESQRLTPTGSISIIKTLQNPVTIHGRQLQEGDVVALEGHSTGMHPAYVDEPYQFRPERWLPDAVAARKGTPSEVIDHLYLKEPFSQGARKCPGSRVASNEITALLAQLVLDWKFSTATPVHSWQDLHFEQRTTVEVDIPELVLEPRSNNDAELEDEVA